jgi:uncharacterized membrane protein
MAAQGSGRKTRSKKPRGNAASGEREARGAAEAGGGCCSSLLHGPVNVSEGERMACVAGGAVLISMGLRRRTLPGLVLAAIGGLAVRRGVLGYCPLVQALHDRSDEG